MPSGKARPRRVRSSFCKLLERRFPGVRVVQETPIGWATRLRVLEGAGVSCIVSSLPLLTRPERDRISLLDEAFAPMGPEGSFVQFTYGLASPMPLKFNLRTMRDYAARFPILYG